VRSAFVPHVSCSSAHMSSSGSPHSVFSNRAPFRGQRRTEFPLVAADGGHGGESGRILCATLIFSLAFKYRGHAAVHIIYLHTLAHTHTLNLSLSLSPPLPLSIPPSIPHSLSHKTFSEYGHCTADDLNILTIAQLKEVKWYDVCARLCVEYR
jgi:hypothetical protein